ncbi:MAG: CoA protein activase [Dehalococcoidia bacterium]|nr:CoA protein activase [Dehalococcoidia bacterium]
MKLGIPHFGNVYVPMKAIAQQLGITDALIIPPPMTQKTLNLGVKYSPYEACLPYKLTLGSLIETCELGANTLAQARGSGICRLGYYAKNQEQILRDLGYSAKFLTIDVSHNKLISILRLIKNLANDASWYEISSAFFFGISKLFALDKIEKVVQEIRAIEVEKGTANKIYHEAIRNIDEATKRKGIKDITKEYIEKLNHIEKNNKDHPLKVGVVGEIYVVIEPFANMDIEEELGKLGVEVERTMTLSRWVKYSLFLNYLGADEWRKVHHLAKPYIDHDVGGDGWESVGEKILFAHKGFDGIVHLAPFTCMPEIVAQNVMPSTREDIPVLAVTCDEQQGKQGLLTRLEAFVDLLEFRRRKNGRRIYNTR